MKIITILFSVIPALSIMIGCRDNSHNSPALLVHIDPSMSSQIAVDYSPYNDPLDTETVYLQPDEAGNSTIEFEFPEGIEAFDATIHAGHSSYGAHIEKDETLYVDITSASQPENAPTVTYSGKNAAISRTLSAIKNGFRLHEIFPLDTDTLRPLPEILADIDKESDRHATLLDSIGDKAQKDYYRRYLLRHTDAVKAMVIEIYAKNSNINPDSVAEYRRIMSSINPDDEIDVRTNLYTMWLHCHNPARDSNDFTAYHIAALRLIDSVMTDPINRRLAFNATATNFTSSLGVPRAQLKMFDEAFRHYAAGYPDLVEKNAASITTLSEVLSEGDKLNFDPELETSDGKKIKLSSLYGKILYIDFWASWCGPCCAEIPHMERLYNHFRNNPGILPVSISVDTDIDAWLAILKKDTPHWPQYRLPEAENERLSKALNINGIPRFIILSPDGTILSSYAPRPSDEGTVDMLERLL